MFVVQNHVHFINESQRLIAPYAFHFILSNSVVHYNSTTSNSFFIKSMNSYDWFFKEKAYSCWPIKVFAKMSLMTFSHALKYFQEYYVSYKILTMYNIPLYYCVNHELIEIDQG